jgi:hypothetical protein
MVQKIATTQLILFMEQYIANLSRGYILNTGLTLHAHQIPARFYLGGGGTCPQIPPNF